MSAAERIRHRLHRLEEALEDVNGCSLATVEAALLEADREMALAELAMLLDSGPRPRSRWSLAGEIERRLLRFETTAWPRILRGDREPQGRLEECMVRILACPSGPRCQGRIVRRL